MRLLDEKIIGTFPSNFNIFNFGDLHIGTILFNQKGVNKLINMMHSEYKGCSVNYGVHHGDAIEAITLDDKRYYKATTAEDSILKQMDTVVKIFTPVKEKLICWLDGNHEQKLWRFGALAQRMAQELDVPFGTYGAKISYKDKKGGVILKQFCIHGRKTITSTADDPLRRHTNMQLVLKRHLKFKAADCALMTKGHTHKLLVTKPKSELYLTDDGKKIKQHYTGSGQAEEYIHPDHRYYGNTGSFMKLYGDNVSGYAEIAEYDPVELGFLIGTVRNRQLTGLEKVVI